MSNFNIRYEFIDGKETFSRKYQTAAKLTTFRISYDIPDAQVSLNDIFISIENVLDKIFRRITSSINDDDYLRVSLRNENLKDEIYVPFRKKKDFRTELVLNEVIKVSQSNRYFLFYGNIEFKIIYVKNVKIGGGSFVTFEKWCRNSNKVVRIAKDGLCLPRSIIVSLAHCMGYRGIEWRRIREDIGKRQTKLALKLCKSANIDINKIEINYESLEKFQNVLGSKYQLICVCLPRTIFFKGNYAEKQLFVQINNNHSNSLLSIKSFLRCNYYCKICCKGYMNRTGHRCEETCKYCFTINKCKETVKIECHICNRFFMSEKCYQNHLKNRICLNYQYCKKCKKLNNGKNHECNKKKCKNCKMVVPTSFHECYITPLNKEEIFLSDQFPKVFVFYDFESFLEVNENNSKFHRPNLCCSIVICDYCWDSFRREKKYKYCQFCSSDEKSFFGIYSVENFLKYIFNDLNVQIQTRRRELKLNKPIEIKVIAHNSKGFDINFIIKYCIENNFKLTKFLKNGMKTLSLHIKNIHFLDSLSFLPMPLKNLPKTFGFEEIKGFFPHSLNIPENWNLIINQLPEKEFYEPQYMKANERNEFNLWYESNKNSIFNFKNEILKYCEIDVKILMKSMMVFRDIWKNIFNMDCMTRCLTLPQAVMEVFKTKYLLPNTIPIIPRDGYDRKRKQSYISNAWLDFIQTKRNFNILREFKILNFTTDGFIPETKEIFEFYGCYYHGCIRCYPSMRHKTFNQISGNSMQELYEKTKSREDILQKNGFNITKIWGCELDSLRENDKNINKFFDDHLRYFKNREFTPILEPRNAFFGGRTNASKLYHECTVNENIFYYDFTSLYPWVCKTKKFPIKHPKRIINFENTNIDSYEGLIFCNVIPPKDLYFPILPMRIKGKLMFTLCMECAINNSYHCNHSEEQRSLTGVWTTPELKKSIELNYKITRIFEVWHFEETLEESENQKGLFYDFINNLIKGKIAASDWPPNCLSEEEKINFLENLKTKENIILRYDEIENNPGKRNTFKLTANSFWGKFGQDSSKYGNTELINEPEKLFTLMADNSYVINDIFLIGDQTVQIKYNRKSEFLYESNCSNVVIASFVTAYARLKLYELLNKIGKRVLYYDTDSIIFSAKPNEFTPDTGNFLGDLTDEITTKHEPNARINKFLSCGPKNYCLEIYYPNSNETEYMIKVKGFSLNFNTKEIINFNSMKEIIDTYIQNSSTNQGLNVPQLIFKTTPFHDVTTERTNKIFKFVYDKRMIMSDYTTLPFGFH